MTDSDTVDNNPHTTSDLSAVGEAWRKFLQRQELSWCAPERIGPDYFARHAKSEWITRLLRYSALNPGDGRVLEAGCGTALFGLTLATLGYSVDAFDYNEEALDYAHRLETKAFQSNPKIDIHLSQGNLLGISAPDNTYALVFNQAVVEYFTSNKERTKALSEMVRVTRPGGAVAVISQNLKHPLHGFWRRTGYPGYTDGPTMHRYNAHDLRVELENAGLTMITTDGINPWSFLFLWPKWYRRWRFTDNAVYYFARLLGLIPLPVRIRRVIAPQIIAVGRKKP